MKATLEFNLDNSKDEIAYTMFVNTMCVKAKNNNNMKSNQVWIKNNLHNNNLDYDYDVIQKDKKYELKYSNSSDWSENIVGNICAKLKDDGNGVKIKVGDKKIKLSYNEVRELKCLLLAENDEHIEIRETNTIKMLK
jgi:hypothetical protein